MTRFWILVEWVEKVVSLDYRSSVDVVCIDPARYGSVNILAGQTILVRTKWEDKARMAQVLELAEDKSHLISQKKRIDNNQDRCQQVVRSCWHLLQEIDFDQKHINVPKDERPLYHPNPIIQQVFIDEDSMELEDENIVSNGFGQSSTPTQASCSVDSLQEQTITMDEESIEMQLQNQFDSSKGGRFNVSSCSTNSVYSGEQSHIATNSSENTFQNHHVLIHNDCSDMICKNQFAEYDRCQHNKPEQPCLIEGEHREQPKSSNQSGSVYGQQQEQLNILNIPCPAHVEQIEQPDISIQACHTKGKEQEQLNSQNNVTRDQPILIYEAINNIEDSNHHTINKNEEGNIPKLQSLMNGKRQEQSLDHDKLLTIVHNQPVYVNDNFNSMENQNRAEAEESGQSNVPNGLHLVQDQCQQKQDSDVLQIQNQRQSSYVDEDHCNEREQNQHNVYRSNTEFDQSYPDHSKNKESNSRNDTLKDNQIQQIYEIEDSTNTNKNDDNYNARGLSNMIERQLPGHSKPLSRQEVYDDGDYIIMDSNQTGVNDGRYEINIPLTNLTPHDKYRMHTKGSTSLQDVPRRQSECLSEDFIMKDQNLGENGYSQSISNRSRREFTESQKTANRSLPNILDRPLLWVRDKDNEGYYDIAIEDNCANGHCEERQGATKKRVPNILKRPLLWRREKENEGYHDIDEETLFNLDGLVQRRRTSQQTPIHDEYQHQSKGRRKSLFPEPQSYQVLPAYATLESDQNKSNENLGYEINCCPQQPPNSPSAFEISQPMLSSTPMPSKPIPNNHVLTKNQSQQTDQLKDYSENNILLDKVAKQFNVLRDALREYRKSENKDVLAGFPQVAMDKMEYLLASRKKIDANNSNEVVMPSTSQNTMQELNEWITNERLIAMMMPKRVAKSSGPKSPVRKAPAQTTTVAEKLVPIGLGNARVPVRLMRDINWRSFSSATRLLLQAVFSRKVLATHSLTGKKSPAFANKPAKKCLDPKLVEDIVMIVSERCGADTRDIRHIITLKCADEARRYRNRQAIRQALHEQDNNAQSDSEFSSGESSDVSF